MINVYTHLILYIIGVLETLLRVDHRDGLRAYTMNFALDFALFELIHFVVFLFTQI